MEAHYRSLTSGIRLFGLLAYISATANAMGAGLSNVSEHVLQKPESFMLSHQEDRLSLEANQASLRDIVEQLGRELNIQVDIHADVDENITLHFYDVTVEEALKYLSENYAYETDKQGGRISRIVLLPKGKDASTLPNTKGAVLNRQGTGENRAAWR